MKQCETPIKVYKTSGQIDEFIETLNLIKAEYPKTVLTFACDLEYTDEITVIKIYEEGNSFTGLISYSE